MLPGGSVVGGEAGTEGGSGRERQSGAPATYTAHTAPAVHKSQVPVPAIAKVSPLAIPISQMKKPRLRKQKQLIPSGTKSQSQNLSPWGQNASLLPRFLTWIFTAASLCSGLRAEQTQELSLLSTTKLGPSLAPSGPRFLPSEEWVELPLLAWRAASRQPGRQQWGRRAGPPCPDKAGGGPPPAAAPQSPVNLLARLEPAAIWSDGLFMEPGGGGPGPDLANLEAISSLGAGSVWSSHQRVGTTPSSPHTLHHPEPRPLWGSLRSPVSCRALQFGPAPRPRALKTRRDWATHTGQDEGVGGEGGGGECRGLPGGNLKQNCFLACLVLDIHTSAQRKHTRNSAQRV